jgi:molybdopterin-containing oxidoreductase family iron-sulfur binding subunit
VSLLGGVGPILKKETAMGEKEEKKPWRCREEFLEDPEFLAAGKNEFAEELPVEAVLSDDSLQLGVTRRDFLKLMGFGTAAVSMACSRMPIKKAIPYLVKLEEIVPGKSYWYASTCAGCSASCGVLVKCRDGRPIKVEGNPESPLNRGGLCATGQATVLDLYDSSRLSHPLWAGKETTWGEVDGHIVKALKQAKNKGGKVRVLSRTIPSPTIRDLILEFLSDFKDARHIVVDPVSLSAVLSAHEQAFGAKKIPHFRFDKAKLIVSLDADFLGTWISPVEFSKQYSLARKIDGSKADLSRHVQFESGMTLTGANADERFPVLPSEIGLVALKLLAELDPDFEGGALPTFSQTSWDDEISNLARELRSQSGQALVVCGVNDVNTQGLVARINTLLKSYGNTMDLTQESRQKQGFDGDMTTLIEEMESGQVSVLFLYDANPVYDAAQAQRFADALKKVGLAVAITKRLDETASLCGAVCADHHLLESWNDAEPVARLFHLSQPVIAPVCNSRQAQDSFLKWRGDTRTWLTYLQEAWREKHFSQQVQFLNFTLFWNQCVHDGYYGKLVEPSGQMPFQGNLAVMTSEILRDVKKNTGLLQIKIYEPVAIRDGTNANNPWLQELPDPISKVTWDNYLSLAPADADAQGLVEGDVVWLTVNEKKIRLPVFLQPGHVRGAASVALGYGRTAAGKVGNGVGVNVYGLTVLDSEERHYETLGMVTKINEHHGLASTQTHHSLEGRDIVRDTTLARFLKDPHSDNHAQHEEEQLWQPLTPQGQSWGMTIDLNQCTGCSACLVSCQVENNVAVVGKDEVFKRREMHWIRLDRYYKGDEANPETVFQPMMCQHCGNAPCESVCPVLATVHSSDGLNQQVYNRCVGTRYCANNCPYKVRRFNWFDYAQNPKFDYNMNDDRERLVLNPDVVVRSRGVMEKCSLCVQRIQEGKLKARLDGKDVMTADIKTACQQSCPADAITFGDLNDPKSPVAKRLKDNPRRYRVLAELNVRPSVNYLMKVRNK